MFKAAGGMRFLTWLIVCRLFWFVLAVCACVSPTGDINGFQNIPSALMAYQLTN